MQSKSTLLHLVALITFMAINTGLLAGEDQSKPPLTSGTRGQNLRITIPISSKRVRVPSPLAMKSAEEVLNDDLIDEAATVKPFDDITECACLSFPPIIIGGLALGITQVAQIKGVSETRALTGGALGANAAVLVFHSLNARPMLNVNIVPDQTCLDSCNITQVVWVVEPKRLAAELVIANAVFFSPKIWKAVSSYFWPTKKENV